jgi:mevalonate kinase
LCVPSFELFELFSLSECEFHYSQSSSVVCICRIPPIKLLLTNTQISRNTKALVTKVGALHKLFPTITSPLFDSVDAISQRVLMLFKEYANETQEEKLLELESQLEVRSIVFCYRLTMR